MKKNIAIAILSAKTVVATAYAYVQKSNAEALSVMLVEQQIEAEELVKSHERQLEIITGKLNSALKSVK